jgi:hypothetical protein
MSSRRLPIAGVFLGILGAFAHSQESPNAPEQPQLNCNSGPLKRTFGSTPWFVYACDDGHSVVVITAPGNPAMPFYFFFVWNSKGFDLRGEGTGNKKLTDAAFEDLRAFSDVDVAQLYKDALSANEGGS